MIQLPLKRGETLALISAALDEISDEDLLSIYTIVEAMRKEAEVQSSRLVDFYAASKLL